MSLRVFSAAGNRFALWDGFRVPWPGDPAALARVACETRNLDGLLLVGPPRAALANACSMQLHNRDGGRAEISGNGLRCVAKLVVEAGHCQGPALVVETDVGPRPVWVEGDGERILRARVDMGRPEVESVRESLVVDGRPLLLSVVSMGNPHAVLVDSPSSFERLAPKLAIHPRFPEGTNVEFVDSSSGDLSARSRARVQARVWERGVGETLSCGSGACAVAAALVAEGRLPAGASVSVAMRGGDLEVSSGSAGELLLEGPVLAEDDLELPWISASTTS